MKNDKLEEIGQKLDVSPSTIRKIGKERRKRKVYAYLIGTLTTILSYLVGKFFGKYGEPRMEHHGYPYGLPMMTYICMGVPVLTGGAGLLLFIRHLKVKKKYKMALGIMVTFFIILTVIAFVLGFESGRPVEYYSEAIGYGVYSRDR